MTGADVLISTDCVCDLTKELREKYNIPMMYCYIQTKEARFQDTKEITSEELLELMEEDKRQVSSKSASIEEYKDFFERLRKKTGGPIIHISTAKHLSNAYDNALKAAEGFPEIYVVDSEQLSGSMGIMVLAAADMAVRGAGAEMILEELENIKDKVSGSFILNSTEYLHRRGKISESMHNFCKLFSLHPILELKEDRMKTTGICIGGQQRIAKTYIRRILRKKNIVKDVVFLITAGCSYEFQEFLKEEVQKWVQWEVIIVNDASATVSCNCGSGTFGVMFLTS